MTIVFPFRKFAGLHYKVFVERLPGRRIRTSIRSVGGRWMLVGLLVLAEAIFLGGGEISAANGPDSGLVMVYSTLDDQNAEQIGSGFVVGFDRTSTFLVTAQHVVEDYSSLRVRFASDPHDMYRASLVRQSAQHDLAVLKVHGFVRGVVFLPFDARALAPAEPVHVLGYPERSLRPRLVSAVVSSDEGTQLVLDKPLADGHSGGPVLRNGWVVGVVKETNSSFAFALPSVIAHRILHGWQVPATLKVSATPTAIPPIVNDEPDPAPPTEDDEDWWPEPLSNRPVARAFPCRALVTSLSGGSQPVRIAASEGAMASTTLSMGTQVELHRQLAGGGHMFYEVQYSTQQGPRRGWMRGDHLQRSGACP